LFQHNLPDNLIKFGSLTLPGLYMVVWGIFVFVMDICSIFGSAHGSKNRKGSAEVHYGNRLFFVSGQKLSLNFMKIYSQLLEW